MGNRLTAFGGFTFEYDDAGNLTRKFNGSGFDQHFYWDALGQLDSVTTAGSPTVRFEYDGLGRRVKRLESGNDRQFVYDGNNLFFEVSANGAQRFAEYNYYPGVDRPRSVRRGGSIYYYATKHAGSVVGLFDGSTAVNRYRYSPYGEDQGTAEAVTNPLRFSARELDDVTGLYYFRSRYYDPSVSRFISEDPIGLAGGINPYSFVRGDPVNLRDPFGLADQYVRICHERSESYYTDSPRGLFISVTITCEWVLLGTGGTPGSSFAGVSDGSRGGGGGGRRTPVATRAPQLPSGIYINFAALNRCGTAVSMLLVSGGLDVAGLAAGGGSLLGQVLKSGVTGALQAAKAGLRALAGREFAPSAASAVTAADMLGRDAGKAAGDFVAAGAKADALTEGTSVIVLGEFDWRNFVPSRSTVHGFRHAVPEACGG